MSKTRDDKLRAVSEAALVKDFSRALGLPSNRETLEAALTDAAEFRPDLAFLRLPILPYPWQVPVAAHVMADKPSGQLAVDLLLEAGVLYLVKDTLAPPSTSLFLAWSGPDPEEITCLCCKGLYNHHICDSEWVRLSAVQLKSCLL